MTFYEVVDCTTCNWLGDFDTREEAEAFRERIRPFGRFGPDGHELVVWHFDDEGNTIEIFE